MRSFLFLLLLTPIFSSFAQAGYTLTVCGAAFAPNRESVHYAQSRNGAQARAQAMALCTAQGRGPCKALCENVFQPTRVSELPPAARRALNQRLAAIDREAARAKAEARQNGRGDDLGLWSYIDGLKRRQREEEITKALEYFRDCQGSGGCPKR